MKTTIIGPGALGLSGDRRWWLAGTLPPSPRLAIVGSRAARRRFREAVAPLVQAAANQGLSVVSGGAVGIDAEVHRVALAAGVPQLAVLPCGPDRPYPPQHAPLFEAIVRSGRGGALFCHAPGTEPTRGMFASRNAVVVGVCDAVVIVQASPRSGTMLTATLARRRGRARAVVAGSTGAAILAAADAHVLPWDPDAPAGLVAAAERWLRAIARGEPPPPVEAAIWPASLHWLRDALRSAGPAGLAVDELGDPRRALFAFAEAESRGLVVERSPGRYVAAR